MAAEAVVSDSYEEASRKLRNLAGVKVPATTLRRWTRNIGEDAQRFEREAVEEGKPASERVHIEADGTGVPVRRSETVLNGKGNDGIARTREAKAIVTFTAGRGGVSRTSDFAARLDRHLCREGVCGAQEAVLISDGAAWIASAADELLAGMRKTCILDVYHALEYASAALKALGGDSGGHKERLADVKARLLNGEVAGVIADLEPHRGRHKDVAKCIDCFESNKSRMRYDEYRARGMRTGSGKVESCCKQTAASRFKSQDANGRCGARTHCWRSKAAGQTCSGKSSLSGKHSASPPPDPEKWRAPRPTEYT